jgi:AmmeMemoRadiSam system protein A
VAPSALSDPALAALLALACDVVTAAVRGAPLPAAPADPELLEPRGVFVSLHARGRLRGCLGHVEADLPLAAATMAMAEAVTSQDPRFPPVRPDELRGMEVEVSVLSPLRPIAPDEVVPGRDGLMIRRGRRAGLLLPQVATEHGMDRVTFLEALCQKAMLPPGAWSDPGIELRGFTVRLASARIGV